MEHAINTERGEVGITLAGKVYPMLAASYSAVRVIEEEIGSVYSLTRRIASRESFPTMREMAVVVAEAIRAAGRDRKDAMLTNVSTEKIAEMIYEEGLRNETVTEPFLSLLRLMITGGKPRPAPAPAPAASVA